MEQETVKTKSPCWLVLTLLFLPLVGCESGPTPVDVTNVPIDISQPNSEEVDIDVVMTSVQARVRERLPDAQFKRLTFSGKCQDLPKLQGRIVILFMQVNWSLFGQQVMFATASVNTSQRMMTLSIFDESKYYPSTAVLPLVADSEFKEIARIAHQHIVESGLSDCDVTITQDENVWDICCGCLDDFCQQCEFAVDAVTGEIKSSKPPR